VEVNISNLSDEARDFFSKNQQKLSQSLMDNGIKLSDLRIDMGKSMRNQFSMEKDSSSQSFAQDQDSSYNRKDQQSQSGSRRDSERRKEIWEMFKERNAA
jgi:hypothetical protein